ncbi:MULTISPECIES: alternative ribosome rescue aminoacyl-tRNA hydrolase ArfB [unclassified Pseudactinotalea]|uniref:alternative ribosome rescue aminoacyl-tRNA hydrolase ArfB n=1 Tax=unclassified Pseudactinotalea TaxID=2649176 RepID=UPI00128B1FEA|nr:MULTISPECIES: alternative ribosome rescue aminoacyl-tRNA hydrolase ArfB [unclassified Pseudactinotalea]MPV49620.1 aminoacyl-tRNA hydrolase [Pseudactinotalea sp. HY160]QGH69919.1 aminoacyl-tRNA hydrolase [Pseudactinotalea sp. HY158]
MDVQVSPALTIPAAELRWRFSRSSGPGGQHVNTADSRVELSWDIATSAVLSPTQRRRLEGGLAGRLVGTTLTVTASERSSQLRNREVAIARLAELLRAALRPPSAPRRATRPTRGSVRRRRAAKQLRSETKRLRRRPGDD